MERLPNVNSDENLVFCEYDKNVPNTIKKIKIINRFMTLLVVYGSKLEIGLEEKLKVY